MFKELELYCMWHTVGHTSNHLSLALSTHPNPQYILDWVLTSIHLRLRYSKIFKNRMCFSCAVLFYVLSNNYTTPNQIYSPALQLLRQYQRQIQTLSQKGWIQKCHAETRNWRCWFTKKDKVLE